MSVARAAGHRTARSLIGLCWVQRLQGFVLSLRMSAGAVADAVFAGFRHVGFGRGIDRDETVEQPPHARGQGLVGQIHVSEQGVATKAVGRKSAALSAKSCHLASV